MFAEPLYSQSVRVRRLVCALAACAALPTVALINGCPPAAVAPDDSGDDEGQDNASNDNQDDGSADDPDGAGDGLPFGEISGEEVMVEAERSDDGNGGSRTRDERFTASFSLSPTSADQQEIFINDELTILIFGDLSGQGHLTYEESNVDVDPELDCTPSTSSGFVTWDVEVRGDYEYIPALGTIRIDAFAVDVSSPSFEVTFTTPGCPEFDSVSLSNYVWQGPGQGVWGFVTIVIENGHFESHLDNPFAADLGDIDFYDITVNAPNVP